VSDQAVKIVKKKVKPYPFDATLEVNAQKMSVEVIFVNDKGVIVRLKNQIVHVGTYYQIAFEIPVSREFVNTQVRVLKTYDKTLDIKEKTVERLAELHFQELTKEHRARIRAFTAAIGQHENK
jgi:hypothetical protein